MSEARRLLAALVDMLERSNTAHLNYSIIDSKVVYADDLVKAANEFLAKPLPEEASTPSSKWFASGEKDPHDNHYDCERSSLCMGNLTDDELANAVFLYGNVTPNIQGVIAGKAFMPTAYLTAAKERIRWLSRKLNEALARKPLTDDEIMKIWFNNENSDDPIAYARAVEEKHGIKEQE